jgi:hypothetical protein
MSLCNTCKKEETALNKKICLTCRRHNASFQKERSIEARAAGNCVACHKPKEPNHKTYCEACLVKRRGYEIRRWDARVKNNSCAKCTTGIPLNGILVCLKCWWLQKATSVGGSIQIQPLQDIWNKQDGKCALSGLELIPGTNASIDHIIPKSKGGTNDISNLQWVLTIINSGKLDLSDDEFIKLCEAVVSHNKNKLNHQLVDPFSF